MEYNFKEIRYLAKNYCPLDYSGRLIELLAKIYPYKTLESLTKFDLHCLLSETLIASYRGEEIYKYELYQRHINRRVVAAFEIKINTSRLDFLTIGSHTTSFEIKSELDNLSKLGKQTADYQMAFEYNYLILDICHLRKAVELIPESFGIWCFDNGVYKKHRSAQKNKKIIPSAQIDLLNKRELIGQFPGTEGDRLRILHQFEPEIINERFKDALIARYKKRWEFVTLHKKDILPIDVQFFFNTNIRPEYVYS